MDPAVNLLDPPANYAAYLVRLWQDSAHGPWRASAQSVQTNEKVLFANLEALCTFLQSHTLARSDLPEQDSPQRHKDTEG